jgi:hypothetical protein
MRGFLEHRIEATAAGRLNPYSLDGQRRIDTERLAGPPPSEAAREDPRGIGGPEALYLGTYTANSSTGLYPILRYTG